VLREGGHRRAQRFFSRAAKIIDTPSRITTGNDLRISGMGGPQSFMARFNELVHCRTSCVRPNRRKDGYGVPSGYQSSRAATEFAETAHHGEGAEQRVASSGCQEQVVSFGSRSEGAF
jgi:hypothetical protein